MLVRVCVWIPIKNKKFVFEWKVWKFPHKKGKDMEKKKTNKYTLMQMTKVLWKLKHKIHKWLDPWSMNKYSNRGLCQSWFLLSLNIHIDNLKKKKEFVWVKTEKFDNIHTKKR